MRYTGRVKMLQPPPRDYQRPAALDLEQDLPILQRITRAHVLWGACRRAGWSADDLMSEVVCRVLARQELASRYDPERSPLGVYLTMVTRGILSNLLEKALVQRRGDAELRRRARAEADLAALDAAGWDVVVVRR